MVLLSFYFSQDIYVIIEEISNKLFQIILTSFLIIIQEDQYLNKLWITNLKSKIKGEEFLCIICGKGLKYIKSLANHHRRQYGMKSDNCGFCEKTFTTSGELKVHMRKHTEEKLFDCILF